MNIVDLYIENHINEKFYLKGKILSQNKCLFNVSIMFLKGT